MAGLRVKIATFYRYVRYPLIAWKAIKYPKKRNIYALAARINFKKKPEELLASDLVGRRNAFKICIASTLLKEENIDILKNLGPGKIWISKFELGKWHGDAVGNIEAFFIKDKRIEIKALWGIEKTIFSRPRKIVSF